DRVTNEIEDVRLNGDRKCRLPGNADFMIRSVRAESLVIRLAARGICVSASSACASRDNRPSHVLSAMGLSDEEAVSSLRITIGEENTAEEIDTTVEELKTAVEDLRSLRR
ncbi:MAG: aminotransferase class V-fold PLP-dependent enzyme, partial [Lachnospiraceae bacterium]|nr:aminotransferase class V-fold PLP-dependent enzyme [Lachnospiraceae bacterium]